ncbi:unnamed protein product [Nesidiocoris tenuis]|uniref:Uncharacterized protein n=1 Tax=Nesidiocoris tenuis TaxID=355587 RepID=A0A6H5G1C8_9HEMI|nr:unnamed protein product [Nesidiocoris tenuis]
MSKNARIKVMKLSNVMKPNVWKCSSPGVTVLCATLLCRYAHIGTPWRSPVRPRALFSYLRPSGSTAAAPGTAGRSGPAEIASSSHSYSRLYDSSVLLLFPPAGSPSPAEDLLNRRKNLVLRILPHRILRYRIPHHRIFCLRDTLGGENGTATSPRHLPAQRRAETNDVAGDDGPYEIT